MASKSLHDIIKRPLTRKVLWGTLESTIEIGCDDPVALRSAVITSTALLEVGLERLIKSRMRRLNSDDEKALFGPAGALSGFSSKIRIAHAFGIIGPMTRHDLAGINDIRNVFAHAPHKVTMRTKKIWNKTKGLHVAKYFVEGGYMDDSRGKHVSNYSKGAGLLEAIEGYALMLCHDRHKRVLLPPTKGTFVGWKRGNTLRF